jgi:hypothetical protein
VTELRVKRRTQFFLYMHIIIFFCQSHATFRKWIEPIKRAAIDAFAKGRQALPVRARLNNAQRTCPLDEVECWFLSNHSIFFVAR